MLQTENDQPIKKKPYTKPDVREVPLRPEEAVLGNCKNGAVSGPASGGNCTPAGPCSSQGS